MRSNGGITTVENYGTWRKICPHPALSTANPTWTRLGFKPDICTEKSVNNHLSYDNFLPSNISNYSHENDSVR
jgi:hypothetical protein